MCLYRDSLIMTVRCPEHVRPAVQDSFLNQFGGSGKGTCSVKATLARFPLRSVSLDPWYQALSYVVDISPPQAHSIVHQHPSLGHLIAIYLDPTRCAIKSRGQWS